MPGGAWTRRRVLAQAGLAVAGAAGLGLAGCGGGPAPRARGRTSLSSGADGAKTLRFVSRPDLSPPAVTVTHAAGESGSPGRVFLTPGTGGAGQGGAMICDTSGELVWFSPAAASSRKLDLQVQAYQGRPVLTWFEGKVVHGHGEGVAVIADTSYRRTHTVRAARGLMADLHEFVVTAQGTALVTAYRAAATDLSGVGGPSAGWVLAGVAQEIDIATGRLLFEWDSLDHVDVTETQTTFSGGTKANPFDYFHINSIDVAPDGDLIISARNTWAVYKIARPGGSIVWRLGGKKTAFSMGPGTRFYWQHDARLHGRQELSLFDDGATPAEERQSRAIVLRLDTARMRATLQRQYVSPAHLLAGAMGDTQLLPGGHVFVGWGTQPHFSEFTRSGRLVLDGRLPANDASYRAFLQKWSGRPAEPPAVAARPRPGGGATVYASWNGATGVATWAVLVGATPTSLREIGAARRTGFETAVTTTSAGPYFAVEPRDSGGRRLARSAPVRLATG